MLTAEAAKQLTHEAQYKLQEAERQHSLHERGCLMESKARAIANLPVEFELIEYQIKQAIENRAFSIDYEVSTLTEAEYPLEPIREELRRMGYRFSGRSKYVRASLNPDPRAPRDPRFPHHWRHELHIEWF